MESSWIGQAVSITCDEKLGIFQGTIKDCSNVKLTIVRAFRNGVPLRKQDAEVTLTVSDIQKIELLPTYNTQNTVQQTVINKPTPVKQPNFGAVKKQPESTLSYKINNMKITNGHHKRTSPIDKLPKVPSYNMPPSSFVPVLQNECNNSSTTITNNHPHQHHQNYHHHQQQQLQNKTSPSSVAKFFGNLIPSKVEVKMGASLSSLPNGTSDNTSRSNNNNNNNLSKPIDIITAPSSSKLNNTSNKINQDRKNKSQSRRGGGGGGDQRQNVNIQTFGTPIDDPIMGEDFDFEGNLALFDKQAIWDTIEAAQKPDVVSQTGTAQRNRKYRHDENILATEPTQFRQIESYSQDSTDFVTDDGLIIPTFPLTVRNKIQQIAHSNGLSFDRQFDILSRGCTDIAIILLGGARRLTPNNRHQYPKITIITDKLQDSRASNIAMSTGRFCASHGIKVFIFMKEETDKNNIEFELFKATGNNVVPSIAELPSSDLVILSVSNDALPLDVKKWISENRSAVLAIDPPPRGISEVSIKCSILPILPLNNLSSNSCGKLYLCNLGIPEKYFRETGCVKYKSPFGSKFVIPIHMKSD